MNDEYTEIQENGTWKVVRTIRGIELFSDDFTHDAAMIVSGDFEDDKQHMAYAEEIARRLNLAGSRPTAKQRYEEICGSDLDPDPLERLRFFCSQAMTGQDWLDVEPFFDDVQNEYT